MILNRSAKKMISQSMESYGFSPTDFDFTASPTADEDETINRIVFKESDYFFEFESYQHFVDYGFSERNFRIKYSPGEYELVCNDHANDFDVVKRIIINWLVYLQEELTSHDPWSTPLGFSSFYKNEDKFNKEEIKLISELSNKTLSIVDSMCKNGDLNQDLKNRLDQLNTNIESLSKDKWAFFFKSHLVSTVLQYAGDNFDFIELSKRVLHGLSNPDLIKLLSQ